MLLERVNTVSRRRTSRQKLSTNRRGATAMTSFARAPEGLYGSNSRRADRAIISGLPTTREEITLESALLSEMAILRHPS